MSTESKRIFIPNLPEDFSEQDVRQGFFKFGDITSIEIKHRKGLNARNYSHKYAFVNIDTTHQLLQRCFDEYSRKKLSGHHIEIQLAKESFLERLKKEREEAKAQKQPTKKPDLNVSPENTRPQSKATIKRFSSEGEGREDEVPTKKSKAGIVANAADSSSSSGGGAAEERCESVENNKNNVQSVEDNIVPDLVVKSNKHKKASTTIEGVGLKPIHVQTNDLKRKSKDPHREKADRKRINSMLKAKQGYLHQKSLIKNALLNIDGTKMNKIIFSDDPVYTKSIDTQNKPEEVAEATKKLTLFFAEENDHEDNEHSFKLREEYEGKKGKQLFEMQNRYNQDARFKVDARFAEDNDNDKGEDNLQDNNTDERRLQLQVLSEVLNQPIQQLTAEQQKTRKSMLRFDPSQPEHSLKYEIRVKQKGAKKKEELGRKVEETELEKLPEVSSETFYKVDANVRFQESGKQEVFSLLQAFGRANDGDDDDVQNQNVAHGEKVSKIFALPGCAALRKYDSSDDECINNARQNTEKSGGTVTRPKNTENEMETSKPNGLLSRGQFNSERFFFIKDDYRFQEGIDFAKRMWGVEDDGEFSKVRQDLKKIVKRKVNSLNKKKQQFRKKIGRKHKTSNRVRN